MSRQSERRRQIKEAATALQPLIGRHVIHTVTELVSYIGGKSTYATEHRDVILMDVSGLYAMVRRPGCYPYVALVNDLKPLPPTAPPK